MSNEDMRLSIKVAMYARAKNTKVDIHLLNGDIISIPPNAVPLPSHDEKDSVMDIANNSNGRCLMFNLEHVSSVECIMPKDGEPSQMQELLHEAVEDDHIRKMFNEIFGVGE